MSEQTARSGLPRIALIRPSWLGRIGLGNLLATVVLFGAGIVLANVPGNPGGVAATALLLLSLCPLLGLRAAPGFAALTTAAVVLITQLAVGPMITCGVIFPLLCIVSFQLGSRISPPRQLWCGVIGVAAVTLIEGLFDPALGVDGGVFVGGVAIGFGAAGLVLRSRAELVERLRLHTAELARRRDRTAAVAVAADRARIGTDLEAAIKSRIDAIAAAAAAGRRLAADGAARDAVAALTDVERHGRETLSTMRGIVGSLHEAPVEPPPGIGDLTGLISRTNADIGLHVDGQPLVGPGSNVDLTAYRIVEQLVEASDRQPLGRVDVRVEITERAVWMRVSGPSGDEAPTADDAVRLALTSAATRAEVVGGRLDTRIAAGRRETTVVLPTAGRTSS